MTEIEKTLSDHKVRPTAMRILIYKYLAQQKIALALLDIETAFAKAEQLQAEKKLIFHEWLRQLMMVGMQH